MKLVLFFTTGMSLRKWSQAGIIKRELKLYNELAAHFDKIYLLTYGNARELRYHSLLAKNIEILYDKFGLGTMLYAVLAPLIHKEALKGADYYKTNQMNGSITAVIAKILYNKRLMLRTGYPWLQTLKEKKASIFKIIIASITERIAYRNASIIFVTTAQDKERIQQDYGITSEKISVISNYVDTELFKPIEHPFQKTKKRLVYIGRFAPEKNLINLIDAVKDLDVELFIIGSGNSGIELKQKIHKEEIKNIYFLSRLEHDLLPVMLRSSDVYVQPSLYEGNPKTILEAMSCGLPVVGTNVRGIRDIIRDGENGYLCGTSAESIKEAIIRAINNGALNVGQNARKEIIRNYSVNTVLKKEMEMYNAKKDN